MTVICDIYDCAYNGSGMCCRKDYIKIKRGTCDWVINNPNYRGPVPDYTKSNIPAKLDENKQI